MSVVVGSLVSLTIAVWMLLMSLAIILRRLIGLAIILRLLLVRLAIVVRLLLMSLAVVVGRLLMSLSIVVCLLLLRMILLSMLLLVITKLPAGRLIQPVLRRNLRSLFANRRLPGRYTSLGVKVVDAARSWVHMCCPRKRQLIRL